MNAEFINIVLILIVVVVLLQFLNKLNTPKESIEITKLKKKYLRKVRDFLEFYSLILDFKKTSNTTQDEEEDNIEWQNSNLKLLSELEEVIFSPFENKYNDMNDLFKHHKEYDSLNKHTYYEFKDCYTLDDFKKKYNPNIEEIDGFIKKLNPIIRENSSASETCKEAKKVLTLLKELKF